MATAYIYQDIDNETVEDQFPTSKNVVILANAKQTTDSGRIYINNCWDNHALIATSLVFEESPVFTISGNYDDANISYLLIGDDEGAGSTDITNDTVGAISAASNLAILLNSQTGSPLADYDTDGQKMLDDNLKIMAEYKNPGTFWNKWGLTANSTTHAPNSTVSVHTVDVSGTLTFSSDVSGTITSKASAAFEGYYTLNDDDPSTYILFSDNTKKIVANAVNDTTSGIVVDSKVLSAQTVTLEHNFRGILDSTLGDVSLVAHAAPSISSSSVTTAGISTGTLTAKNGIWAGKINSGNNGEIKLDASEEQHTYVYTPGEEGEEGESEYNWETASISGNTISSTGISATQKLEIAEMGTVLDDSGNKVSASVNASLQDITIIADSKANEAGEGTPTTAFDSNKISVQAISSGEIILNNFNEEASIEATLKNVEITLHNKQGGDPAETPSCTFTNNTFLVQGIQGTSLTTDSFKGEVSVKVDTVTMEQDIITVSDNPSNNTLEFAAVSLSGELKSTGNLDGTFTVTFDNCTFLDFDEEQCKVYGIKAEEITVNGRINSNITVTQNIGVYDYALSGEIKADAFAGKITTTGGAGIYGSVSSQDANDAFDISGTIDSYAIGISSGERLNLRISGNISASGYSIYVNDTMTEFDNKNDFVTLVSGANVTGDIELFNGKNAVTVSSEAKLNGSLLATNGSMNLTFNLEEIKDGAIIATSTKDVTLSTASTISFNLDYADNGTYTLLDYGADVSKYWGDSRTYTFIYQGKKATGVFDTATQTMKAVFGDAEVTVGLSDDKTKMVATTTGFEHAAQYSGTLSDVYSTKDDTLTVSWTSVSGTADFTVTQYELEYTVYDTNGEDLGKSISVTLDAKTTEYAIKAIEDGQTVDYRLRAVDTTSSASYTGWSDMQTAVVAKAGSVTVDASNMRLQAKSPDADSSLGSSVATLTWTDAVSDRPIRNYVVEYFQTEEELTGTTEEINQQVNDYLDNPSQYGVVKRTKTVSANEIVLSGLTDNLNVYWRVKAYSTDLDENNKPYESDWKVGDRFNVAIEDPQPTDYTSPTMGSIYASYSISTTETGKYNLSICWNEATDEYGLKDYLVEYVMLKEDTSGEEVVYTADWNVAKTLKVTAGDYNPKDGYQYSITDSCDAGKYAVRVTANNIYGKSGTSEVIQLGASDITAPKGSVNSFKFSDPVITYSFDDSESEADVDSYTASVTLNWTDDYTDDSGVVYKIQFSDSEYFNTEKTYTYYTVDGQDKSFYIDNKFATMSISTLASIGKNVYYRVMAMDNLNGVTQRGLIPTGNETGEWSAVQNFKFVDANGNAISTLTEQYAPEWTSVELEYDSKNYVYTGYATLAFTQQQMDLNIDHFILNIQNTTAKTSSDTVYGYGDVAENADASSSSSSSSSSSTSSDDEEEGVYEEFSGKFSLGVDGKYKLRITNVTGTNQKKSSSTRSFTLDTTRPDTVAGLATITDAYDNSALPHGVYLAWTPSADASGIAGYDVCYRKKGDTEWITANSSLIKTTTYVVSGLDKDGTYEFAVYAYDNASKKSGASYNNRSLISDVLTVTVDSSTDYSDNKSENLDILADGDAVNTIGLTDTADWFRISACDAKNNAKAGKLSLNMRELNLLYGSKNGITVKVMNSNSQVLKTVKFTSVSKKDMEILIEQPSDNYIYFQVVTNNTTAIYGYNMGVKYDVYNTNNNDDYYEYLTADYTMKDGSSFSDWVGWGDSTDYRYLALSSSGKYTFTIAEDGDDKASISLTLYQLTSDKNGVKKLKSLKSVSVKDAKKDGVISNILLDGNNTYYVRVYDSGASKGKNADYTLSMESTVLYNSPYSNSYDDSWDLAYVQNHPLNIGENITDGTTLLAEEWVGYGDVKDYRKITMTNSGKYSFTVNAEDQVTVTLWEESNGKLKKVASGSGKSVITTKAAEMDKDKEYYISVESKNASKGGATDYDVLVSGVSYEDTLFRGSEITDTVDDSDPFDVFKVTLDGKSDTLKLDLDDTAMAAYSDGLLEVELWNKSDKAVALVSHDGILESSSKLSSGNYTLKFTSKSDDPINYTLAVL